MPCFLFPPRIQVQFFLIDPEFHNKNIPPEGDCVAVDDVAPGPYRSTPGQASRGSLPLLARAKLGGGSPEVAGEWGLVGRLFFKSGL